MNSWNATNISQWIKQVNGRKLDASQLKVDKKSIESSLYNKSNRTIKNYVKANYTFNFVLW